MKKRIIALALVAAMALSVVTLSGCGEYEGSAQQKEAQTVANQDGIYGKSQPIPVFNYSLPRDLWIQFYKAQTSSVVRTWSVVVSDYGTPLFATQSIGYPIPLDTQLTNPQKVAVRESNIGALSLPQSEPNGLYTSQNTNGTIVMTVDGAGKVAPVYSEHKVLSFPFPVRFNKATGMYERAGDSTLQLDVKK